MLPCDADNDLVDQFHGSAIGDPPVGLTTSQQQYPPQFHSLSAKWGPALGLRASFRHYTTVRPRDNNVSLAVHLGNQVELQDAVIQCYQQCKVESYIFSTHKNIKHSRAPADALLDIAEIFASGVSSDIFTVDFSRWPPSLILSLANLGHSTKIFKKLADATAFLRYRMNGEPSGDHHNGAFCELSLFNMRIDRLVQEQPASLRDWASSLGLVVRQDYLRPGAFMHHVSHIANFCGSGSLSDATMEEKMALGRSLLALVRLFVDKTNLSPAAFQTLVTTPRVLPKVDVKPLADLFRIPLPSSDSNNFEGICDACTQVGSSVLTNIWYLNDNNYKNVANIPALWYAGMYYHLTAYALGSHGSVDPAAFRRSSAAVQIDSLCNVTTVIARSVRLDVAGFDFYNATEEEYRALHDSLRPFNAFASNNPDLPLLKAQVISFKYHSSPEGQGEQFYKVLQDLGMDIVALRVDFSLEHGPTDGPPIDSRDPKLGPASDECPRRNMTCSLGLRYMAQHGGSATTADLQPIIRKVSSNSVSQLFPSQSPIGSQPPISEVGSQVEVNHIFQHLTPSLWRSDSFVSSSHRGGSMQDHGDVRGSSNPLMQQKTPVVDQRPVVIQTQGSNWLDTPIPSASSFRRNERDSFPLSTPHPALTNSVVGSAATNTLRSAVRLGNYLNPNFPATSSGAVALMSRCTLVAGSEVEDGDVILVCDPVSLTSRLNPGVHQYGLDDALLAPMSALRATLVPNNPNLWFLRLLRTDIHGVMPRTQSVWPSLRVRTQAEVPQQALRVSDEARIAFVMQSVDALLAEDDDQSDRHFQDHNRNDGLNPASKRPRGGLDMAGTGFAPTGGGLSAKEVTSSSNQKVPVAAGVFYSKTAQSVTDRAKFIPFLLNSVPEDLLVAATGDSREYTNSYVMSRILPNLFTYWMSQIDLGLVPPHLSCLLKLLRNTVYYKNLLETYPDIALSLYQFDWKSSSCLDQKTCLFLDYFLPFDDSARITTVERLYLAMSTLNKVFYVLFSWEDLLLPVLKKMRPLEGVYDTVCGIGFWLNRMYSMLFKCSQAALNKLNHGPLIPAGQNEQLLRNIVLATANSPFNHTDNLRFDSEHMYRVEEVLPLTFPRANGKLPPEPKTSPSNVVGGSINKPTAVPKGAPHTSSQPPILSVARDFSAFQKAGIDVPPKVNAPAHLLCVMDLMQAYKVNFENGHQARCTRKHDLRCGLRVGTRLHYDEIASQYPERYSLASAFYQVCHWLNDKPLVAAKVMKAVQADKDRFK